MGWVAAVSELRAYELSGCGKDGYPLAWHESIKDLVRKLAGDRCARCGHPYKCGEHGIGEWSPCDADCTHGGPIHVRRGGVWEVFEDASATGQRIVEGYREVEARWRILTVHHLDGDKLNCRWWNLAALCQRCHLAIQGKVQMARIYPLEHSDWFKPYAAGWYAFTYLDEDLTREETLPRLDELLNLERVA